jgi:hypothetical protein
MNTDRRAILSLVAMGRITPREAERLLAVWPDGEDAVARLAVSLAFAWLLLSHLGDWITGITHALAAIVPITHHALACIPQGFGGLL